MNNRIKNKKAKSKAMKLVKALKREIPGIKLTSVKAYSNGDFFANMKYKDILIHYNSTYKPNKVLFEFEELLDKWRDWRVYHDIEVRDDLKSTVIKIKDFLEDIYNNYTVHFVNSLIRGHYLEIDKLSDRIDISPQEYYKNFNKEQLESRLNNLNIHQNNLNYLKSLNSNIIHIKCINGEYEVEFQKEPTKEELDYFFKEGIKIQGCLSYNYRFLKNN